jgi:hypothetical protein
MDNSRKDDTLMLVLIAALGGDADDDPYFRELLYRAIRRHRQFRESWGPELEELLERSLHGPRRSSRRLGETREIAASVLEGFRQTFEASAEKRITELLARLEGRDASAEDRISALSERLGAVEALQSRLHSSIASTETDALSTKHTLHDFMWLLASGADLERAELRWYVPVRLFLGDPVPDPETRERLLAAVLELLSPLGFERSYELPAESGSWWKKVVVRTKALLGRDEVRRRLETAERAVEAKYLDKPQAEANSLQAAAAASLIGALATVPNACVQVGTLLLVKATGPDGKSAVVARTLTADELKRLEEQQSILKQPEAILEFLQAPRGRLTTG